MTALRRRSGRRARRFARDLRLLLGFGAVRRVARLRALAPAYRTDRLLELAADLSDVCVGHDAGRLSSSAVRDAALAAAMEAGRVWLATASRERACPVAGDPPDVDPLADSPWDTLSVL